MSSKELGSLQVKVNGMQMHGLAVGSASARGKRTVLLVHGLGLSSEVMRRMAEELAPFFTVHAVDLPGFGHSAKPRRALTIPELADSLAGWLEATGSARAAIVGESVGSQIAVDLAARYPERAERLVLVSPTPDPTTGPFLRLMARWCLELLWEFPMLPTMVRAYWYSRPRRFFQLLQCSQRHSIEDQLGRVRCPTLVVRGAKDPLVSQAWAEKVARLVPEGRLVLLDAPHAISFLRAPELAGVLREFFER